MNTIPPPPPYPPPTAWAMPPVAAVTLLPAIAPVARRTVTIPALNVRQVVAVVTLLVTGLTGFGIGRSGQHNAPAHVIAKTASTHTASHSVLWQQTYDVSYNAVLGASAGESQAAIASVNMRTVCEQSVPAVGTVLDNGRTTTAADYADYLDGCIQGGNDAIAKLSTGTAS